MKSPLLPPKDQLGTRHHQGAYCPQRKVQSESPVRGARLRPAGLAPCGHQQVIQPLPSSAPEQDGRDSTTHPGKVLRLLGALLGPQWTPWASWKWPVVGRGGLAES